jgi:hypothetical protein
MFVQKDKFKTFSYIHTTKEAINFSSTFNSKNI